MPDRSYHNFVVTWSERWKNHYWIWYYNEVSWFCPLTHSLPTGTFHLRPCATLFQSFVTALLRHHGLGNLKPSNLRGLTTINAFDDIHTLWSGDLSLLVSSTAAQRAAARLRCEPDDSTSPSASITCGMLREFYNYKEHTKYRCDSKRHRSDVIWEEECRYNDFTLNSQASNDRRHIPFGVNKRNAPLESKLHLTVEESPYIMLENLYSFLPDDEEVFLKDRYVLA